MREPIERGYDLLRAEGPRSFLGIAKQYLTHKTRERIAPFVPLAVVTGYYGTKAKLLADRSDANPARPVWVDPDEIEFYHGSGPSAFGLVADGDWDRPAGLFENHPVHESFRQRFTAGAEWAETPLYQSYSERLEAGDPYWRCTTEEELEAYFDSIDKLHRQITEQGYRSQRELLSENPAAVYQQNTDAPHPLLQEIGVNIYRDGKLAKKGAGLHRLSLAKIIGVEIVPATVRVRHSEWQAVRDEIADADAVAELGKRARNHLGHPDLRRIVPPSWESTATASKEMTQS